MKFDLAVSFFLQEGLQKVSVRLDIIFQQSI